MIKVSLFRPVVNLFRGGKVKEAAKVVEDVPQRITKTLTDPITGVVKLEREILSKNGEVVTASHWTENLGNGTVKYSTRIDYPNGHFIERTKNIKTDEAGSIFGGKKITVEKDKLEYWCNSEKSTMVKEYSPKRDGVEHIEYTITHESGNGLNDWEKKAVSDRVFDEVPLSHSVDKMLKSPMDVKKVQHKLDGYDNYHRFHIKKTNYERAVEAKEKAAAEAAKKAKQEAIAAKELAAKEAAELAAKRPRVNAGKVLGLNIEELKVVEKTRPNGEVVRYYFAPGNNKPVIKTLDQGIRHEEWIMNGKQDVLYMKQIGKDVPYIVRTNGEYVQVSGTRLKRNLSDDGKSALYLEKNGKLEEEFIGQQTYYDGSSSLRREAYEGYGVTGKVEVYDANAAVKREKNPHIADIYPDYPRRYIRSGDVDTGAYSTRYSEVDKLAQRKADAIKKDMDANLVNLQGLFEPYKA